MSEKENVVTLRTVADRVGLAPCSVSAILNNTQAARAIPQQTKERVYRAVADLNYRPNLWARSLRTKRTRLVAAITPDIGQPAVARVIASVQNLLHRRGYMLVLGSFDCASEWNTLPVQLHQQGIEGLIAIDAILPQNLALPVASVELEYLALEEPLAPQVRSWLAELGESAAETVLRQIEKESAPRRTKVVPKFAGAYASMPTGAAEDVDTRERA